MKTTMRGVGAAALLLAAMQGMDGQAAEPAAAPPAGFVALFNGRDLAGWWGAETENPRIYLALPDEQLARKRADSLADIQRHWRVENDELVNDGQGLYLTTEKNYGDFELRLEYRTVARADSGIYLRGCPQVQIWDWTDPAKESLGAAKGSGGLWNNSPGAPGKDPLVKADRPFGEWNAFRIVMVGARVWVWLNDQPVVVGATMENYYERKLPLPARGPIQLQTHGGEIRWRNVLLRELPADEANRWLRGERDPEGFVPVFNGKDFAGWKGPVDGYEVKDGAIACRAGHGGTIFTETTYTNFVARLEFNLPPGGNNGLAIRYPGSGDTAYVGLCELQVLDDGDPKYAKLDPRQFHGSAYGMVAAQRGHLRPAGTWNYEEVTVSNTCLRVELNGTVILDADLAKANPRGFMDGKAHPGKDRKDGHFGFAGHNDPVRFRNIAIRPLE